MAGRIVPPFTFSGGMTEIELGSTSGRAPKNKLFKASHLGVPGGIMVQLRCEPLSTTTAANVPVAEIEWQVGSGLHSAVVDIGLGSTFSVSAAEVLDVSVRINTEYNPLNIPTTSIPFRCFGTAAPATATSAVTARFTNLATLASGSAESNFIDVPKWAKKLWVQDGNIAAASSNPLILPNLYADWDTSSAGGGAIGATRLWNAEVPFIVPGNARRVRFYYSAHGASDDFLLLNWELELG